MIGSRAGHVPSILVASLSAAFGVALLQVTGVLTTLIDSDPRAGSSPAVAIMLTTVAIVFIAIAVYVGAVVTANTFATIIAGRTRTIALVRLIGATARQQRGAVARDGLIVGIIGAIIGTLGGTVVSVALVEISIATGFLPRLAYAYVEPVILLPITAVILTTWIASWVGSRRSSRYRPWRRRAPLTRGRFIRYAGADEPWSPSRSSSSGAGSYCSACWWGSRARSVFSSASSVASCPSRA
jgi:putative ABC transport system permease protein